jgi:hypothetical protein
VKIPEVFAAEGLSLLRRWSPQGSTPLGTEFHLLRAADEGVMAGPEASLYAAWRLPVEHSWPCRPRTMEGFVEKAAQALARTFAARSPQTILVGLLQTGTPNTYYKKLASNLRGRALQVFPPMPEAGIADLRPDRPVLYCLLGPEGLYAGMATPREANGLAPGGARPVGHGAPEAISRAGAKIEEALDALRLHRPPPPKGAHWLELGASPGGMTRALLARQYRVTAVDRAPLDARLDGAPGLTFCQVDAPAFRAPPSVVFDALLCDLNGSARAAMAAAVRQAASLRPGAPLVFTLKLAGIDSVAGTVALQDEVIRLAQAAGLSFVAQTHLPANRREFTLFFESAPARPAGTSPAPAGRRVLRAAAADRGREDEGFRRAPRGPESRRGRDGRRGR